MGRIGVDIYPLENGVRLEDVARFGKFLGGSATNVAVAAARHGHAVRARSPKAGNDPFGRYVRRTLRELGVDPRSSRRSTAGPADAGDLLRDLPAGRLPAVLLPLPDRPRPPDPGRRPAARRDPRTPRSSGRPSPGCRQEPSPRRALRRLGGPRAGGRTPSSTSTTGRCSGPTRPRRSEQVGRALEHSPSPSATARSARSRSARPTRSGPPTPCSTAGWTWPSSSRARRGCSPRPRDERVEVAPFPVEVVNGLGAGDAFGGALVHGLLAGLGPASAPSGSPTSPAPSSPPASSAPPRCRPTAEVEAALAEPGGRPPMRRVERDAAASLTEIRATRARAHPRGVGRARSGARLLGDDGRLLIVAADHPARGALGVRDDRDGDGQPDRPARAGSSTALARPGRRRRARHARRPRRPAAPGRARGQGRHRLDEPRRSAGRRLRARRPLHRLHGRRRSPASGSTAARC